MKTVALGGGVQISTPFLTAEEAAVYLGVSWRTLKRLPIKPRRIGGQQRYDARELDDFGKGEQK